jgi:hypothetical protein
MPRLVHPESRAASDRLIAELVADRTAAEKPASSPKPRPKPGQVRLWDRVFVRCARVVDPLTRGRLGKWMVGNWQVARA